MMLTPRTYPCEASWIREVDLWQVYRQRGGVTASFLFEDRGESEGMDLIFARPGVSFNFGCNSWILF